MSSPNKSDPQGRNQVLSVWGFKSISNIQSMELRPLTLLAGANSSGKSSMMQPLLLLKQTLEVPYDPGALLLDGPNVRFSSADQIFSRSHGSKPAKDFGIRIGESQDNWMEICYERTPDQPIDIKHIRWMKDGSESTFGYGMNREQILLQIPKPSLEQQLLPKLLNRKGDAKPEYSISRERFFLKVELHVKWGDSEMSLGVSRQHHTGNLQQFVRRFIHLPGLRGSPARNYPVTAVGDTFSGTFDAYTASVIAKWQSDKAKDKLEALGEDLIALGLTWKVSATRINDTQVELMVGRLPKPTRGGAKDLVSIADVGFGVSQTLPVIVALHAAQPGQTVYLEQPEIHLHPRAQVAMARVLARAIRRGVRLIVETHSSLLLLAIQTLVAKDDLLTPADVKLHWFQRKADDGSTYITSADLDETGAFGEWPEDFGDVSLEAENAYITAAEARLDEKSGH